MSHIMSPQRHHQNNRQQKARGIDFDDFDDETTKGRITGPSPERIIRFAFALIALKATNDAFERHHGTSPLDGVLKGLNEARKRVARAIAPNDGSSKKGRPAGNNKKKKFTGKGKKLGRK